MGFRVKRNLFIFFKVKDGSATCLSSLHWTRTNWTKQKRYWFVWGIRCNATGILITQPIFLQSSLCIGTYTGPIYENCVRSLSIHPHSSELESSLLNSIEATNYLHRYWSGS